MTPPYPSQCYTASPPASPFSATGSGDYSLFLTCSEAQANDKSFNNKSSNIHLNNNESYFMSCIVQEYIISQTAVAAVFCDTEADTHVGCGFTEVLTSHRLCMWNTISQNYRWCLLN